MSLLSNTEVLRLKLSTIPSSLLKELGHLYNIKNCKTNELIKKLIDYPIDEEKVNEFIRQKYGKKVQERRNKISDEDLLKELNKVVNFQWGVVQGQLDNKIQVQYVRKYHHYDTLLSHVSNELYSSVRDYVICTWYNHWTTVVVEDLISTHHKVVPTLKNIKGVDLFFGGQPFDLKITYMPDGYPDADDANSSPKKLAIWLYENQGSQRFGAENRLFVVVHDLQKPEDSWKIKRDITFIKQKIDNFFEKETVSEKDEIIFFLQKTELHSYRKSIVDN